MSNTIDTAAAESLRNFAVSHGEFAFAHLVTAAMAGEEWAIERVSAAAASIKQKLETTHRWYQDAALEAIRATDTTRPDGAIARSFQP